MRKKSLSKTLCCLILLYIFNLTMLTPLGMISQAKSNEINETKQVELGK